MLCCRRISAIGTPASPCFRTPTIWLSVNRDFRMGISLTPESLPSNCLPGGEAYGLSAAITTPSGFTNPIASVIRASTPGRIQGAVARMLSPVALGQWSRAHSKGIQGVIGGYSLKEGPFQPGPLDTVNIVDLGVYLHPAAMGSA